MKHFFIDSENVGDFWIPLLNLPEEEADLTVFYTKNSPHMSYESLIRLKESDRKVTFVKCYEGTNALDFQLCSELGFQLCAKPGDEFIIVTNDTGFDAAVKYWRHRKYHVRRITGKESRAVERQAPPKPSKPAEENNIVERAPEEVRTVPAIEAEALLEEAVTEAVELIVAEAAAEAAETPAEITDPAEQEKPEEPAEAVMPQEEQPEETEILEEVEPEDEEIPEAGPAFVLDEEELVVIASCIGLDNLAELHNQLIQFYGESGKDIYQSIKNGSLKITPQEWDKSEKFLYYCALIVRHSDLEEEYRGEESISALADFLCGAESKRRNLNSLRYALLKKFGKDLGRRYYFLLKPYVKAMNQM